MVRQRKSVAANSSSTKAAAAPTAMPTTTAPAAVRATPTPSVAAPVAAGVTMAKEVDSDYERAPNPWRAFLAAPTLCVVFCFALMSLTSQTATYWGAPSPIPSASMRIFTQALNMHRNGQTHKAMDILRTYVSTHPRDAEGFYELALYERMVGLHETAAESNRRAIALRADFPEAYINLGVCLENMGNFTAARDTYMRLLSTRPSNFAALSSLGSLSVLEGKLDEAHDYFKTALHARGDSGVRLRQAITMAPVYSTFEELQGRRERVSNNIKALSGSYDLKLRHDALLDVNSVPFFLPYTGINNVVQMRLFHQSMIRADESLLYTAPHLNVSGAVGMQALPLSGTKIRVGVISRNFRDSDAGKMIQGFAKYLSRENIELFIIMPPQGSDAITQDIQKSADVVINLPYSLTMSRQIVGDLKLHALLFPDCAAEPFSYYMAFSRLAPVQATTLSYPGTTGLPTIDYFVSFEDIEPQTNQVYYTEKLVTLPGLGSRYVYAEPEGRVPSRSFFGIEAHEHVYFVPHDLHKLHPSFDQMLTSILRTDVNAKIALVEPKFSHWQEMLLQRLINAEYAPPDTKLRVVFFPPAPTRHFLNFYSLVDVVLDAYPMGGESCVREALSQGKPVVTLPTMAASGSITQAYLRRVGTPELITTSLESYVNTAVRLNTDSTFRARITQSINFNRFLLYNDQTSMDSWAKFFVDAVKTAMPDLPFGKTME